MGVVDVICWPGSYVDPGAYGMGDDIAPEHGTIRINKNIIRAPSFTFKEVSDNLMVDSHELRMIRFLRHAIPNKNISERQADYATIIFPNSQFF